MAGRPRKEQGEEITSETIDAKQEIYTLKDCPKCGEPALQPYKDSQGNFRCHCSGCKYWDVIVSDSPSESVRRWEAMGGPGRID